VEKENSSFSDLPNSAAFHLIFDEYGMCLVEWLGKKYLRERVHFNETVLKWIQNSKRDKKSVFYEAEELFTHLQYI